MKDRKVCVRRRSDKKLPRTYVELEARVQWQSREIRKLNEKLMCATKERATAEEELYRSRKMFQMVLDNIPQRVFWKDKNLRYLGCNRSFAEHAGLSDPRKIVGMDDSQMPWEKDAARYREDDRLVMERDEPRLKYDVPQLLPDGRRIWQRKNKLPLHDRNGAVIGVMATFEDITESISIKKSLIKSENILAEAEAIAHVGSWEYCLETKQEFRSAEFFKILGYGKQPSDYAHDSMFDYIHPQDRELVREKITETLEQGKRYNVKYRIVRNDGQERFVHAKGKVVKDDNDHKTRFIGTIQDITDRKRIEDALLFTQFSVDRAAVPIFWIARSGQLLYFNNASRYLGYSPEQLACMTIFDIDPRISGEEWAKLCKKSREEDVVTFQSVHKTRDDDLIPVDLTINRLNYNEQEYYVVFAQDIRERKHAEERNRKQLERLAALRAIDMAISESLDIRVTLNVVLDQVVHLLHADAADILLLNHAHMLEHAASRGFRSTTLKNISIPFGKDNAGHVAYERRLVHIPDVTAPQDPHTAGSHLRDEGFIAYYGTPLIAKGEVVGVLEVYYRGSQTLEQERLDFLEALAGQAAIAIDNATLFTGLKRSNIELKMAYDSTLEGWSRALDLRDKETEGHCQRVTEMAEKIAMAIGVPDNELIHIRRGAMLHDIGKVGIPDHVLLKPGPLDRNERMIMERHPVHAFELLSPIAFLRPAMDIPYCHHEKWDGSGYPRGLKGKQIPLAARIFAVIDVWDALCSDRPYRPAWPQEKALEHIRHQAGIHFDPEITAFFLGYVEELALKSQTGYIN